MIIKRSKFMRNPRSSHKNNSRRNSHLRSTNYDAFNTAKVRTRGNPNQLLSKYLSLAKSAVSSGDTIQAEYYYQHADHFSRLLSENGLNINIEKNDKIDNNIEKDTDLIKKKNKESETVENEITEEKKTIEEDDENEKSLNSVSFLSNNSNRTK